jgi:hypothetical protein
MKEEEGKVNDPLPPAAKLARLADERPKSEEKWKAPNEVRSA